jgi:anti-sigma B factor antagonist
MAETTISAALLETSPDQTPQFRFESSGGMGLAVRDVPGGIVVALTGELDVATAPALDGYFRTLASRSGLRVVVDLSGLTFCDCSGVNALLRARRLTRAADGWLGICGAAPGLRNVLRLTRVSAFLHCYPTAADAASASD